MSIPPSAKRRRLGRRVAQQAESLQRRRSLPGRPAGRLPDLGTAASCALALHAVLISAEGPGHQRDIDLGTAVGQLSTVHGSHPMVERRFQLALTASTLEELAVHLRALVSVLRRARIGVDVGLLADDLDSWHDAAARTRTRMRWAREYARARRHLDQNTEQEQS